MFAGTIKHLDAMDQERLTINAISLEALTASDIDSEILDRGSDSILGMQTAWRG